MSGAGGRLAGKVAVVTGAASGIGLATARKLAAEGAAVVLGDIAEERLGPAVESIVAAYGKQGIRCNAVAPGVIMTANNLEYSGPELIGRYERHTLTPHLGTPADVTNLVAFLFSDEAAFISGEIVYVDGGFLAHFPTLDEARDAAST